MRVIKKPISILLALLMLAGMFSAVSITAGAVTGTTADGFAYSESGGKATITGYTGAGGNITIPSTIGSYQVTGIASLAFHKNENITGVTIPAGVTSIGVGAFLKCININNITVNPSNSAYQSIDGSLYNKAGTVLVQYALGKSETSFSIPNGVTTIDTYAISYCPDIVSINIPNSVTTIGDEAICGCPNLTDARLPSSVTNIGVSPFEKCPSLTSITIDPANTYFKVVDGNLYNAAGTTLIQYAVGKTDVSFTVPSGVTRIKGRAFSWCENLQYVIIPTSTATIEALAFNSCTKLESITIPASVTSMEASVFNNCEKVIICGYSGSEAKTYATNNSIPFVNISNFSYTTSGSNATITGYSGNATKLAIPGVIGNYTVTAIGNSAFYNKTAITSVVIPYGVISLGDRVFDHCTGITSVTIPSSVTDIGQQAFCYCTNLNNITIPFGVTSIGYRMFYNCMNLESAAIPNSVETLGTYVFYGCTKLESITIPNRVSSIGDSSFTSCRALTSILIPRSVTSIVSNAFSGCTNATIYGYDSSTADTYASTNSIDFVPIINTNTCSGYTDAPLNSTQTVESDGNSFGLDKTTYNNIELLGVQSKTSSTKDIRYVAVLNEGLVKETNTVGGDIADYGFVVAKCSATTTAAATENNIKNVTKGAANTTFVSCKSTSNNLCGDYGVCDDSSTKYKYVTMTINDVDESQGFVVRFFVQTKSGRVYYANYNTDYTGCVTNYSGLTSAVA